VSVAWHRADARHFTLEVTVPDNVVGTVRLPALNVRNVRERGHAVGSVAGVKVEAVGAGTVRVAVGSGRYSFSVGPASRRVNYARTLLIALAVFVLLAAAALVIEGRRRSSTFDAAS
jgi:hypothetical protein